MVKLFTNQCPNIVREIKDSLRVSKTKQFWAAGRQGNIKVCLPCLTRGDPGYPPLEELHAAIYLVSLDVQALATEEFC